MRKQEKIGGGGHVLAKQRRLRRRQEELSEAGYESGKSEYEASDESILQRGGRTCEVIAEDLLIFTFQLNRQWGLWHNTPKDSRFHL